MGRSHPQGPSVDDHSSTIVRKRPSLKIPTNFIFACPEVCAAGSIPIGTRVNYRSYLRVIPDWSYAIRNEQLTPATLFVHCPAGILLRNQRLPPMHFKRSRTGASSAEGREPGEPTVSGPSQKNAYPRNCQSGSARCPRGKGETYASGGWQPCVGESGG